ncbi:GYDIA family GHMP kinase [Postechiella marina]|uniref:GYDIA family GHMP kinase n=1 Tax=Postechiella marina TaxID=943941 RepID=A0ABP8CE59_9FLAO
MKSFRSNGKLLISGEYLVLDGACALAIPTKYGQTLSIEPIEEPLIIWKSLDFKNNVWFEGQYHLDDIKTQYLNPVEPNNIAQRLIQILVAAKTLNKDFLAQPTGFKVTTTLDFPQHWGLGTSSTLINNIAQWANINPYTLLANTFGGSGYDIACAQSNTPITYLLNKKTPISNSVYFNPKFSNHIYFVYLNKKQNSRDGIAQYKANRGDYKKAISKINNLTSKMILASTLETFNNLITEHENIVAQIIKQPTVKAKLFADFKGEIKSLGAWGGDFILVTSKTDPVPYFNKKGFDTVLHYKDMVL